LKGKTMTTVTLSRQNTGLALFWTVTFVVTWAFWGVAIALGGPPTSSPTVVPFLLGGFGPVFGAIAVRIRRARLGQPVPAHTVKFAQGIRFFWVLPLLMLASGTVVAAAFLSHLLGGPDVSLTEGRTLIATAGGLAPFLVSMVIGGPLAEEPGWRGTAYPRLRASMNRYQAGLVLGVVWAIWHLPLFFIPGTIQASFGLFSLSGLMFSLSVIPMALLTGYAYERAGVAAAMAVHFGVNTTIALLTVDSPITQGVVFGVQLLVAVVLVGRERPRVLEHS
jgi:membrane protease YdiL (CAAX protease family)